ncbi:uncharacterized protein LOC118439132 isoform X1 [Folsomia candida]|uniref:uncharacterized protein LOC118439132 isoform X1 n=1 Tax=Folsomia candida TaxID=158441 RepID=UPI001604F528|nr:uncharacterized protein LOC118439132 isoform X1 [Folsomia candida]
MDNNLRHVACNLVKILGNESFQNLKSLELHPTMANYQEAYSSKVNWTDVFPENVCYPGKKLTILILDMGDLYIPYFSGTKLRKIVSLTTRILSNFRHVAKLKMSGVPGGIFDLRSVTLPQLRVISLRKWDRLAIHYAANDKVVQLYRFKLPLGGNFENVTRYEFNVLPVDSVYQFDLFRLLAPQLEQVCIFSVTRCTPKSLPIHVVPVLPRLKVFEVSRDQRSNAWETWFRPELCLRFESGEGNSVKLVYAIQFPLLEKLRVHVVPGWFEEKRNPCEEHLDFEATMLLLCENFLADGIDPCETVRNLDISFPQGGNLGSMEMIKRCGCKHVNCACWGWKEEVPNFYERIFTIFPNLEYYVVEMGRANVRAARIQKIAEMGVKWGLFKEEGDFEKMLGSYETGQ